MKKFKYAFPRLTLILIIAGLAVCLAGFILNLCLCITDGVSHAVNPVLPAVLYILTFFITIGAAAESSAANSFLYLRGELRKITSTAPPIAA